MKVLKPFFQFLNFQNLNQVHNMFATMLNPTFKSLQAVENLVGCGEAIQLAFEDDLKVIIPLLMTCFATINPIIECWMFVSHSDVNLKMKVMCLGLEHPLSNLLGHLLLKSHFCLGDYSYPLLHVKICLLGSASMKSNI